MPDTKTMAVFFPFMASCCIGLLYATTTKFISTVTLSTYVFIYCVAGAALMGFLHFVSPIKLDFSVALRWPIAGFIAVSVALSLLAWLLSLVTIREVSATYAAIGEISYPLFTALFTYFIFRSRDLDWRMIVGGLFIATGSILIILDKAGK